MTRAGTSLDATASVNGGGGAPSAMSDARPHMISASRRWIPPLTSLGNMVGYGREYLTRAPWIMLSPAAVIVLTTLSISIVGDWLRDRLDPRLRQL